MARTTYETLPVPSSRPIFVSALLYDVKNFELDYFRRSPSYVKDVFIFSRKAPGRIANWTD